MQVTPRWPYPFLSHTEHSKCHDLLQSPRNRASPTPPGGDQKQKPAIMHEWTWEKVVLWLPLMEMGAAYWFKRAQHSLPPSPSLSLKIYLDFISLFSLDRWVIPWRRRVPGLGLVISACGIEGILSFLSISVHSNHGLSILKELMIKFDVFWS